MQLHLGGAFSRQTVEFVENPAHLSEVMTTFPKSPSIKRVAAAMLCAALIAAASLTACAPAPGTASTIVVADSIGFGTGSGPSAGYGFNQSLARNLAGTEAFVGGPGEGPVSDRWAQRTAAVAPAGTLILQACCNDFRTEAEWRSSLLGVIAAAKPSKVVVVTTPPPDSGTWFSGLSGDIAEANEVLRAIAYQHGYAIADLAAAWPQNTPGVHTPDGLHLTPTAADVAGQFIAGYAK